MTFTLSHSFKKLCAILAVTLTIALIGLPSSTANAISVRSLQVPSTTNPAWPNKCGLKIALLVDRSNSIDSGEGANLKTAAKGFVDALTGTPSQVAVAQFRQTASQTLGFTSVTSAGGATTVKNVIDGYVFGTNDNAGSTNWDAAFYSQKDLGADVVVILTDGNPTVRGINGENGNGSSDPSGLNLDAGITSANLVKANGARVVAVGIGSDVDVSNLQAVSGPTANDDYFVSSFATLNTKLQELAAKICGGTVTVQKQVKNADGSYTPTNGWNYTATNAVTTSKQTAGQGTAEFKYEGTPKSTTITETLQSGYLLESVECKKNNQVIATSQTVSVALTVNTDDIISCVFKNKPNTGKITINKVANGGNGTFSFSGNIPGHTNFNIATSNGSGTTGQWTVPAGSYTVSETVPQGWTLNNIACTGATPQINGTSLTVSVALDANVVCTFTNTRQTANLTVVKNAIGGNGIFSFTSNTPLGNFNLTTVSGTATTSTVTVPTGSYTITENALNSWGLTSANCTNANETLNGSTLTVELSSGANVVCTFTNTRHTGKITIVKNTVGGEGTFGFTSNSSLGNFNLSTIGGTATTGSVSVNTGSYSFTENVPTGWTLSNLQCSGTTPQINGSQVTVNVTNGANIVCTYTNTRQTGTLTIVKNTLNGNDTSNFTSNVPSNGSFSITTSLNTGSKVFNVPTGTYSISEAVPAGWDLTGLTCNAGSPQVNGTSVSVSIASGANVTCTFTNTRQQGNVTVVKNTVGGNATFGFTSNSTFGNFNLTTVNGSASTSTVPMPTGTYTFSENALPGWSLTGLSCTGTTPQTNGSSVTITVIKNANIVCTFTNTRDTATLRIVKNSNGGEGTFGFTSNTSLGNFNLSTIGGTASTSTVAIPTGSYNVAEIVPSGWALSNLECSGTQETLNASTASFTAAKGDVIVCTFTNTRQTGSLTLVKNTVGGNGTFGFTTNVAGNANVSITTVNNTGNRNFTVPTGSYNLSETVPAGWDLTSLSCNGGSPQVNGSSVSVTVANNAQVVCTFTNTRQTANVRVVKNTSGGNATFAFESNTALGNFNLTTVAGTATTASVSVPTGSYNVSEDVLSGWSLTGASCTGTTAQVNGDTVSFAATANANIVCTFTNTRQTGSLTVVKNTVGGNATFDFLSNVANNNNFDVTTVNNTGSESFTVPTGTYELEEVVPAGWDLTDLECDGGNPQYDDSYVTFVVGNNADVTCTFENTRQTATITVVKDTIGGNGTFSFESDTPLGDFDLATTNGTAESSTVVVPTGTYEVSEVALGGWTLDGIECVGGDYDVDDNNVEIDADADEEIVCTFTNSRDTADITIIKSAIGGNGTFSFESDTPLGDFDLTTVFGGAAAPTVSVDTGTYTISESDLVGWELTDLSCEGAQTQVNGGSITFVATKDANITCTFENTRQTATLQVVKTTVGGNATFGFTSDTPLGDFDLTTVLQQAQTNSVVLPTGTYVIEENILTGWSLTGLSCTGTTFVVNGTKVEIQAAADEEIVCTYINTQDPQVQGTVVTRVPAPQVLGTSVSALPVTGARSSSTTVFALLLIVAGGVLVGALRRRKSLLD